MTAVQADDTNEIRNTNQATGQARWATRTTQQPDSGRTSYENPTSQTHGPTRQREHTFVAFSQEDQVTGTAQQTQESSENSSKNTIFTVPQRGAETPQVRQTEITRNQFGTTGPVEISSFGTATSVSTFSSANIFHEHL